MADTKIQWCDKVWQPVTGCSFGCSFCYASRMAHRELPAGGFVGRKFTDVRCHPERLTQPLHWKKPQRIFCCSMGDLFGPEVPFEFIDQVFAVMALSSQHTFIVLTKRPERMREYLTVKGSSPLSACPEARVGAEAIRIAKGRGENTDDPYWDMFFSWPLPNVILGVSVTNQADADERIPILLDTPAAVRCLSVEPMLGPVVLPPQALWSSAHLWTICGGQTGPGAQPIHPDWVRSLRDQCKAAGVPFFFKAWGEWSPDIHSDDVHSGEFHGQSDFVLGCLCEEGTCRMDRVGKKSAGNLLDGVKHEEFPEVRR